jgi:predicted dehydrogenase/threonine dehydrogenase-like Zn-dependent dehydrogenase
MKQIFIRGRRAVLQEVGPPPLDARGILVRTAAAAISTGTETAPLRVKRRQIVTRLVQPEMREKVRRRWREGSLWEAARKGLPLGTPASPRALRYGNPTGYSCAGEVIEVGAEVREVQPGDRVACAGSPHAEIVSVPANLFVPIPESVEDVDASFVAIGSVALHGVRQAKLSCGENVVVMGLGIVGQLVTQIVHASGARGIALDPVAQRAALARELGAPLALDPSVAGVAERVLAFTGGLGADAVFLCMGSTSAAPIRQALDLVRQRGRLIVVGAPRLDIPRGPFYAKEVELRISRSYGPGRADPSYEREGHDYPIGYVRWTARRNMAEFLRLLAEGRVRMAPLVTHRFPWSQAGEAYETAAENRSTALGIVLTCGADRPASSPPIPAPPISPVAEHHKIPVAVVGPGSFARSFHLPNLVRSEEFRLEAVVAKHQRSASHAAAQFGAHQAHSDFARLLSDPAVGLIVLATPHHLHASQTIAALEAGKAVFCEKPMGMTREEVDGVVAAVERSRGFYAVGFNRRFAPTVVRARELLAGRQGPLVLNYRVAGTFLPAGHWVHDPALGGGRIVGETCHFFDLLCFLVGLDPIDLAVTGGSLSHPATGVDDNLACTMAFADGSIATLIHSDLGRPEVPKERLEIFAGEGVLQIDDFRELQVTGFSGQKGMRLPSVDKGHRNELETIGRALLDGSGSPVPAPEGRRAMELAFRAVRLLRGRPA